MSTLQRLILVAVLVWVYQSTAAQHASQILGQWKGIEEPDRQMEFTLGHDGRYQAHIIHETKKTSFNGKVLIKNLVYDSKTKSYKGIMSPPDADIELAATISFESPDKLKIVAKKFVMTKTFHLERLK